ncbi:YdhK family protein [Bacillus canaveralius]|uniref:YdhK family protein n=1 Tax=Bacillus canaveralius TaxID=1403243 RepID=UPI0021AD5523|nr:YdhK family protein [Bacillus canaveralius]
MKRKKLLMIIFSVVTALSLTACADNDEESSPNENNSNSGENMHNGHTGTDDSNMDHSDMNHSGSGEVPDDLKEAENPTYPVGSQAIIKDGHMEGMKGAEATIVGAYDTTAYTVSYTPTTGGARVENHKWVIHEEIPNAGEAPLEPGTEVKLEAGHMEGMEGATAEIDTAEQTTVYIIDFTPTTGGEKVTNHKWVTESELSPR